MSAAETESVGPDRDTAPSHDRFVYRGAAADRDPRAPLRVDTDGTRIFGAELDSAHPLVALAQLAQTPSEFEGQTIRTRGTVNRVCQRMGCWIELVDPAGAQVRVPMAGHAFFLPRDVQGHEAEIDGTVRVAALSAEQRAHLASEGALVTHDALSIDALAVAIH